MKTTVIITILTLASTLTYAQKTGYEIMEQVDNQINLPNEYQEMKMSLINSKDKRRERQLKMYIKRDQDLRKSLIVFTSPSDIEGSAFLAVENNDREDDNWLYLPAIRRSRRVSSSDITDKFMGSDFTYEDLEEEDMKSFNYKLLGEEKVGEMQTYKIEATPSSPVKAKETGYAKRIVFVDKASNLVVKTIYFDKSMNQVKTYEADKIQKIAGTDKYRVHFMRMTDFQKDHATELMFNTIKVNNDFKDGMFSKRMLEKGA